MADKIFSLETEIQNFKSHFSKKPLTFNAIKPITVISGPNGEGKSNLLDAILFGLGNFITKSPKLRNDSSFTQDIFVRENPLLPVSFQRYIFTDYIKYGLKRTINFDTLPKNFRPSEFTSYGKSKGYINTIINCKNRRGTFIYGDSFIEFDKKGLDVSIDKNKLEKLDLLYINSSDELLDLFVRFIGQEYTRGIESIQGRRGQSKYYEKILKYFPDDEGRLIQDIDSGKFEEKYSPGKFGNHKLPTGAKKECLLYAIGILKEKHKNDDNWMSILLIDEFESGLHITRKKMLIDSLIRSFKDDDILKNHVKILLTTHSPVIYSELQKYPELVDVNFVLRDPGKNSIIYNSKDIIDDNEQNIIEKKILSELGLNVYSIPKKIVFVEGPTDKLFFEEIFKDVFLQPLYTYTINKPIIDFVRSFPIARLKEYYFLVDKNGRAKVTKQVNELKTQLDKSIKVDFEDIGYNSLEEFIFNIHVSSGGNVSTIWRKIENRLIEINAVLSKEDQIKINFNQARNNLESKGREGLKIFLNRNFKENKNFRKHYTKIGKLYKSILNEDQLNDIKAIAKKFKIRLY